MATIFGQYQIAVHMQNIEILLFGVSTINQLQIDNLFQNMFNCIWSIMFDFHLTFKAYLHRKVLKNWFQQNLHHPSTSSTQQNL
jgi:hypothetical protein